ncbi:MAG: ABC transporter permease subunit [Lawsonibacter sp.]|nr:ABC transporter permease subunit [Lawsonibacter sp.]MCI9656677.1 ABC transporter permease subunit [Lawsonibacter sp.]
MFNMLRMDLRRLFKSRSFYIVLGITALLLILVTVMARSLSDPETLAAMEEQGAEIDESDRMMSEYIQNMSQLDFMHESLGSGFLLVMTGIGMTLFVNGDFSSGFIKNICCVNPRRRDYVLSKVALAGIYSGIITVLSVLLILLSPVLIHMYPVPDSISQIWRYTLWMWLPHWAFALMTLALVLLTRSTTLGIILSLVAGSGLTAAFVGALGKLLHWPPLEQFFLSSVVKSVYVPQNGITQGWMILACTLTWAAIYGIGSLLSMEKRDI